MRQNRMYYCVGERNFIERIDSRRGTDYTFSGYEKQTEAIDRLQLGDKSKTTTVIFLTEYPSLFILLGWLMAWKKIFTESSLTKDQY